MPDVPPPASDPFRSGLVTHHTEVIGDVTVVHITGEVDMATADDVDFAMRGALTGGAATVVLDLTGVSFFASSGLQLLVRFRRDAMARNVTVLLVARNRAVLRPMEVTGLMAGFPLFATVTEAVASRTSPTPRAGSVPADHAAATERSS